MYGKGSKRDYYIDARVATAKKGKKGQHRSHHT